MDTHRSPAGGDGGASEGNHAAELIASEHTLATAPAQAHAYAFHPLADIFPLIEGREFDELVADIKGNGLHECIVVLDDQILDGRNRYRACIAAGEQPLFVPYRGDDPAAYVVSMNVARRHLTQEQKRELVAKLLEAHLDKSDRQIAATAKTDHKTVGKVRRAKIARGEIPHVETKADTKGRQQPSRRAQSRTAADASTTATPPDPNPLIAAWDKASRAQRQELVTSRKLEVLRAQQQIGVSAYEVELADGGATCAGSGAAGSTTAVMSADPFDIPPMLDRTGSAS
jgi:hypothetical protein